MTVKERRGASLADGVTWHVSVPYQRVRDHLPCYELIWDADGMVNHTGRYALMASHEAATTQQVGDDEPISDDDPRICTKDQYRERWLALNRGDWSGGIPDSHRNAASE